VVALFASLRLGEKKQSDGRRALARAPTPFNFRGVPIKSKDGITRIVNGLEEDDHAKSPSRKEAQANRVNPSLGFQGRSPWL